MKRLARLLIPALALSLAVPYARAAETAAPAPTATLTAAPVVALKPYVLALQQETPLAQGLSLTRFERLYPNGWVNGWLMRVDLTNPAITTDLVTAPGVTKGEALSAMATRAGAAAAINGDYFDIGQTGIALGSVVRNGEFLQSSIPQWPLAAGLSKDRIGRLLAVALEGSVTLPGGSYKLGVVNLPTVPAHSIGLFTPLWTIARTNAMYGATEATEVIVQNGKVVSVGSQVTQGPVPADGYVLVGREEFAKPLAALKVGDKVTLSYGPKPDLRWAVGGMRFLIGDGKIVAGLDDKQYKPRTALGFSHGGRRMYLLAVDGRSALSGGLTLQELAEMMQSFGATDVLELDGGGSTTMVARLPGQQELGVLNQPSDGRERSIPNGVGVFTAPGSGLAKSLAITGEERLFPGLSRRLTVTAYDEQYGQVEAGHVTWQAEGEATITPEGLFRAERSGFYRVTAKVAGTEKAEVVTPGQGSLPTSAAPDDQLSAQTSLRVLGALDRIEVTGEGLRLPMGTTGSFTVRGYDADGYSALIDPADLSLTFDTNLWKVEAAADGVRVTPLKEGSGLVKVAVQGKEAYVPVASTQATTALDLFDRSANWTFQKYPAMVGGSLFASKGRTGDGLKLLYTFGEGGTRAAYAQATPAAELPGTPEAVGLWVKGDGKGAWLRAVLTDGAGASYTVDLARHVDWTDWRYVEAAVPAGVKYPVKLQRLYPVETDQAKRYSGMLLFDDLTVKSPVALPAVPAAPAVRPDPILQPGTPAGSASWTFALVGGLGVQNGTQQGAQAGEPLQQLRQILAQRPSFLLLDKAQASAADEETLTREAGSTPIHGIAAPVQPFDLNGIRFIPLGTQAGNLRETQFYQLQQLQQALDQAGRDQKVRRVVLLGHHAPQSFTDQREGDLLLRWLTQFEAQSGKQAAYLAVGGTKANVLRTDGIPIIELGSPKAPLLLTIDPTPGAVWLRVESR